MAKLPSVEAAMQNPAVAKTPGRPHAHGEPTIQVAFRIPEGVLRDIEAEIEATGLPVPRSLMVVKLLQEALEARQAQRKPAKRK